MGGPQKNLVLSDSVTKLDGLWVEMKNRGLKIGGILDGWTYQVSSLRSQLECWYNGMVE